MSIPLVIITLLPVTITPSPESLTPLITLLPKFRLDLELGSIFIPAPDRLLPSIEAFTRFIVLYPGKKIASPPSLTAFIEKEPVKLLLLRLFVCTADLVEFPFTFNRTFPSPEKSYPTVNVDVSYLSTVERVIPLSDCTFIVKFAPELRIKCSLIAGV
ncbi:hypothetical protein PY829_004803 [Salmonella enterica]|nr:hypothetical protein [Salmonella enterica]